MPAVRLEDVIETVVYQDLAPVDSPEKTAFFESGVATRNPLFDSIAQGASKTAELPFWNDINADDEPSLSSDDPDAKSTPAKITQGEQSTRKAFLNHTIQATDLARELLMGPDAAQHVRNRFGTYWMRQWQRRAISTLQGVYADNVANDAGDMVFDIAAESVADQSASTRWSQDAFVEAAFTMGDMADGVSAIAVHSSVAKQITQQNGAEDVRDSDGNLLYQAYLGRRIIIDDGLPVIAGATDGFKYLSILFGTNAIGYGVGSPVVPVEVERDALAGNGGGVETITERNTWLLHPSGFKTAATPAGISFTRSELAAGATWDRVVERKNVPIAFLMSN